ncbi:hypothetical protein H6P81_007197 [Aristolochia fimbriata]|uniref:Uncharacterized protein n=1 Tax=Aristolochia fimbriata TaxID=158543 RepID=A0AAV7F405_ARIFI|nr:hypothetical protein H6P81_007197 [Aristolochia fimbriata]
MASFQIHKLTSLGNSVAMERAHIGTRNDDLLRVKQAEKVKEVRNLVLQPTSSLKSAEMIDSLQQLGIDHHFQEEIGSLLSLCYQHKNSSTDSLYHVAVVFRLLRQHGFDLSPNVFDRFQDGRGGFNPQLGGDVKGMLALYESSFLQVEGEDNILEEAEVFAKKQIEARLPTMGSALAKRAKYVLDNPFHMTLPSYSTKFYLNNSELGASEKKKKKKKALQELAKVNFNCTQFMHLEELKRISKWWSDMGLSKELAFARNQPLKWFVWTLALGSEARFSNYRVELSKPIAFVYVIDDIFDTYASLQELILFTEAVNRWNIDEIESLPEYMKICFSALYNTTNEIAEKVVKEHGWNPIDRLRRSWAALCNAFLVEAKWFNSGHLPPADEYLRNGIISTGLPMILLHLLSILGEGASTFESGNILEHNTLPVPISSPSTILRLWDDLGSAKDENQQGYDGSYVQCYRKEKVNALEMEKARGHVKNLIRGEWKKLNKACLFSNSFSPTFRSGSLNAARLIQVMYDYSEDHRLESLEQHIDYLLREPFAL